MSSSMLPTIHLNGTSAEALRDENVAAASAVQAALVACARAAPNARDYYVQGPGAWGAASREHELRLTALRDLRNHYERVLEHLNTAIDAKAARKR